MDRSTTQSNLKRSQSITVLSIWMNIFLSSLKIAMGTLGHSSSVVTDGLHSFSDLISDIFVLWSVRFSNSPPDTEHPYGHRKMENIASLFLGLFLIAIGAFFIFRGIQKSQMILRGQLIYEISPLVLFAAGLSIFMKEWLFVRTKKVAIAVQSSSLAANAWHHRSDSFSSIAVFIGIGLALCLGKEWVVLDPIISIFISFFIIFTGWKILMENVDTLLDKGMKKIDMENIQRIVSGISEVQDLHAFRSRYYGNLLCLDFHVLVDPSMTISQSDKLKENIEQKLKQQYPIIFDITINIESYL